MGEGWACSNKGGAAAGQRPRRYYSFWLGLPLKPGELRECGLGIGEGSLVQFRVPNDAFLVNDHQRPPSGSTFFVEKIVGLERGAVGPEI